MSMFNQEWRVLLLKVVFLGTNYSNACWKLWELCILSSTVDFLDLERTAAEDAAQPVHLTDGETGSHGC